MSDALSDRPIAVFAGKIGKTAIVDASESEALDADVFELLEDDLDMSDSELERGSIDSSELVVENLEGD